MELKANNSRVLMSEVLKEQIPEGDDAGDPLNGIETLAVYVVVDRRISGQKSPLTGILSSVLFGAEPEVELMVNIGDALETINASQLEILGVELQYGEDVTVPMPGPFNVKAARLDKIDVIQQSCVLSMQLARVAKR
jgi:hypothetical protein